MKKISSLGFGLCLPMLLSGCINMTPSFMDYPDPAKATDPIDYMLDWYMADRSSVLTLGPLDRQIVKPEKNVHEKNGYRVIDLAWCSEYNGPKLRKQPSLSYAMSVICTNSGGSIMTTDEGFDWCRRTSDQKPLFGYARLKSQNGCMTGSDPLRYSIVAPKKDGSTPEDDFLFAAGELGFTNDRLTKLLEPQRRKEEARLRKERQLAEQKRKAEAQRAAQAYEKRLKAEQNRIAKETPKILKTRGLKICKRDNWENAYPRFVGWVEDSANGKVKIQIDGYYLNQYWSDNNFRPRVVWDDPTHWRICE